MKKWIFVLCAMWVFVMAIPVSAAGFYVVDNAGLLTAEESAELESLAADMSAKTGVDFVILTEYGIGGYDPIDYAAVFYDYGGYSLDGIILFLDMSERDWCIVTFGTCIESVTDYEIDWIGDVMVPYLSDGQYISGFQMFLEETMYWMDVSTIPDTGKSDLDIYIDYNDSIDVNYARQTPVSQCILMGTVLGAVVGLIVCLVMKSRMNTAKPQFAAGYYIVEESFNLLQSRDRFLYSNVSKVRRPQNENHSRGGIRGGSGRSHGGRGGKF